MDISKYIDSQLRQIDISEIVKNEVRSQISSDIKRELKKAVEKKVDSIIDTEIEIALEEPVTTDDGWGSRKSYPHFSDLFKKVFKEKMASQWDIKRSIEKMVKEKVDEIYKNEHKTFMNRFEEFLNKEFEK